MLGPGFRLASPAAAQTELLLFVKDAPPTLGSFDCSAGKLNFSFTADSTPVLVNAGCGVLSDQHFVALIPIMRSLAVRQTVSVSAAGDSTPHAIHDASFSPTHVVYDSFTSDISAPAGSHVSTACTFVNTTGHSVTFGESAHDEYCFSGICRYPVATGGSYDFLACGRGAGLDFIRPES